MKKSTKLILVSGFLVSVCVSFILGYYLSGNKPLSSTNSCSDYKSQKANSIADYPDTYDTLKNLEDASDAVFSGKVMNCGVAEPDNDTVDYSINVIDVKKGEDLTGSVLINFSINTENGVRSIPIGTPELFPGQDVIVFAKSKDGKYYPHGGGAAVAIKSLETGKYELMKSSGLFGDYDIDISKL